MYGERKDKSVGKNYWNEKTDMKANYKGKATGGNGPKSSSNVRFDHPSGGGPKAAMNPPVGMNARKPY